jgi:hypothetical protein
MKSFTIDTENAISVFATAEEAAASAATPFHTFGSERELTELAAGWPAERLQAIWNSLPGVAPVKKFRDQKAAIGMIWTRIQTLAEPLAPKAATPAAKPEPKSNKSADPKADTEPKGGARAAKGAPPNNQTSRKAPPAKAAPKGKKVAQVEEASAPRDGSKMAEVIAMLRRKNGATIIDIMRAMGWQRHTVRGFVAGALKKAGHQVESFKPTGGERSYRLNQ